MTETVVVAAVSIFLYFILSAASSYSYYRLWLKKRNATNLRLPTYVVNANGRFDDSKRFFFLTLAASAFLDIPFYVECLASNAKECVWFDIGHTVCWSFHLLALTGYAVCLGIPLFLWSDIINGKDGSVWTCESSYTKIFLHVSIGLYAAFQLTSIIALSITSKDYFSKEYSEATFWFESMLITFMALGWFLIGVRLQIYIRNVQLRPEAEGKIVMVINMIMLTVCLSFVTRAVLTGLRSYYENLNGISYAVYALGTRWLPYIFCSFLLIHILRRSDTKQGAAALNSTQETADSARLHASLLKDGYESDGGLERLDRALSDDGMASRRSSYRSSGDSRMGSFHSGIMGSLVSDWHDDSHSFDSYESMGSSRVQSSGSSPSPARDSSFVAALMSARPPSSNFNIKPKSDSNTFNDSFSF